MNKRKREGWPIIVYRFWADTREVPQEIWNLAKAKQRLWNDHVVLRNAVLEKTANRKGPNDEKIEMPKPEKKAIWEEYNREMRLLTKASGINWEDAADVEDRFRTASQRAIKDHGQLKIKRRLDKVVIIHRFTGGGMPVEQFFGRERGFRFSLQGVDGKAYDLSANPRKRACFTRGKFGIKIDYDTKEPDPDHPGETLIDSTTKSIEFCTILHRPIPAGSFIKKVSWCGRYFRYRKKWEWSIQLTVEINPSYYDDPVRDMERKGRVAALDLGWRKMEDGRYLRVGMIVDNEGNKIEIRLPLDMRSNKTRNRVRHEYNFETFPDMMELDRRIGNQLEVCKEQIREIIKDLNENAEEGQKFSLPAGFVKMRQYGLRQLLFALTDPDYEAPENDELGGYKWVRTLDGNTQHYIAQVIEEWDAADNRFFRIKEGTVEILLSRRKHHYEELAHWLSNRYEEIVWEGNLDIKRLREQHGNPILDNAKKHSNWAAVSMFRSILSNACRKNRCILTDEESAFSTRADPQAYLGADAADASAKREIEYPSGHVLDQDVAACLNLLKGAECVDGQKRKMWNAFTIPQTLKQVAVPYAQ